MEKQSKKIWIWNHYATNMFFNQNGRHYNLAKQLIKAGYDVTVFCANTFHGSDRIVKAEDGLFTEKEIDSIKFVFIKTPKYIKNLLPSRISLLKTWKNSMAIFI